MSNAGRYRFFSLRQLLSPHNEHKRETVLESVLPKQVREARSFRQCRFPPKQVSAQRSVAIGESRDAAAFVSAAFVSAKLDRSRRRARLLAPHERYSRLRIAFFELRGPPCPQLWIRLPVAALRRVASRCVALRNVGGSRLRVVCLAVFAVYLTHCVWLCLADLPDPLAVASCSEIIAVYADNRRCLCSTLAKRKTPVRDSDRHKKCRKWN